MSTRILSAFLAFLLTLTVAQAGTVDTLLGDWTDTERSNRDVPYKIYYPPQAQGARPIVIFSHGLGGNRDGAEYLLRYLAENGYVAVAVQHPGSDTPAVFGKAMEGGTFDRGKLDAAFKDGISPSVAVDRFRDIPFALDRLAEMNKIDEKLRGHLDLNRIGLSGHSYGAITTLALAGQGFGPGGNFSFADSRIVAAIAYSPSKPHLGEPAQALASVRIPTFHMTGTNDMNPLDRSEPAESRQIPYRNIVGADKYLVVFNGGDHMIFSGRRIQEGNRSNDAAFHALIQKASLAYWDAYLNGSAEAKTYLTGGKFAQDLGAMGKFEFQLR